VLLRNEALRTQNALLIQTVGKASNRDGIGARITLMSGGRTLIREIKSGSSYLSQNDMRAHFGLGRATMVDRLVIRWPSGKTDNAVNVPANAVLTIREGDGIIKRTPFVR
jgi:hypothetical protein